MKIDTEILCSFIDGELDARQADKVRAALAGDQKLQAEYEGLLKTAELVRSLPAVSAPAEILIGVMAAAERDHLLGAGVAHRPRRFGLYWGMSVAASLLLGVALGVLGYRGWSGRIDYAATPAGPGMAEVAMGPNGGFGPEDKFEGTYRASRDLSKAAAAKNGPVAARSGPAYGEPEISSATPAELPEAVRTKAGLAKSGAAYDTLKGEDSEPLARGKADYITGTVGDMDESAMKTALPPETALKGLGKTPDRAVDMREQPLAMQVSANNYINVDMAANLDFEREPLNVKVLSNNSDQTIRYVQEWARNNSLVNLNDTPVRLNLPVYTQFSYSGEQGRNIRSPSENSILLRTTRRQAVEIVGQLEQQSPVVVSVSVKDRDNYLGLKVRRDEDGKRFAKLQEDELGTKGEQASAIAVEKPSQPSATVPAEEQVQEALIEQHQLRQQAGRSELQRQTAIAEQGDARQVLFELSNQRQVQSLSDLVTLVVSVENVPKAAEQEAAGQPMPGQSGQEK